MALTKYYTKLISASFNSAVYALDKKRVAKILANNSLLQLNKEAEKMKFANAVNNLVVKFYELKIDDSGFHMLVMERLFSMEYRAFESGQILKFLKSFRKKLVELHSEGFVFNDLNNTVLIDKRGEVHTNYILTKSGFRLFDTGLSISREDVGDQEFEKLVERELTDFDFMASYISKGGPIIPFITQIDSSRGLPGSYES